MFVLHFFQGLWIGLNDKYFENTFLWVNGVDLRKTNFTNWLKGEPANSFGNEDCVEVHGKFAPGKWNDNYCSSLRNYICEKKQVRLIIVCQMKEYMPVNLTLVHSFSRSFDFMLI